jgi:hypothetical protein
VTGKKKETEITWIVEVDPIANESIARELARIGEAEEREVISFRGYDGLNHNGWIVGYTLLKHLFLISRSLKSKIEIYVEEDGNGLLKFPIKVFEENYSAEKKAMAKEKKAIAKKLKEIRARKAQKRR